LCAAIERVDLRDQSAREAEVPQAIGLSRQQPTGECDSFRQVKVGSAPVVAPDGCLCQPLVAPAEVVQLVQRGVRGCGNRREQLVGGDVRDLGAIRIGGAVEIGELDQRPGQVAAIVDTARAQRLLEQERALPLVPGCHLVAAAAFEVAEVLAQSCGDAKPRFRGRAQVLLGERRQRVLEQAAQFGRRGGHFDQAAGEAERPLHGGDALDARLFGRRRPWWPA
jgi:hypothetical protein